MLATKGTPGGDRLGGLHRLNGCRDVLSAALASDDNPLCTLRSGKHENHGRRIKSESHPQVRRYACKSQRVLFGDLSLLRTVGPWYENKSTRILSHPAY